MSKTLNNLVMKVVQNDSKGVDLGDAYAAAKVLENEIIDEVCREQADKINRMQKEMQSAENGIDKANDIRNIVIQCVVIALLIGLLCNHIYTLLQSAVYSLTTTQNLGYTAVGLVVLVIIVLLVLLALLFKALSSLYKSIKSEAS